MKKKLSLALALLMAASITLSACSGSQPPSSVSNPEDGSGSNSSGPDTLIVAIKTEPRSLDCHHGSNDSDSTKVQHQLFDTLVWQAEGQTIEPRLATSWEYTDDTTLIIKLRDDVVFHNGEKLTADDVLFTFARAKDSSFGAQLVDAIDLDATRKLDDYSIEVNLSRPSGALLSQLCTLYIVSEKYLEEVGDDGFAENPIGSGPFVLKEWYRGDRIVLETFDDYWGTIPDFKTVVMRVITEPSSRAIEIESGGVHVALDIEASDMQRLSDNPDVKLLRTPSYGNAFIGFNCKDSIFSDKLLRQAVSYAIDKESIVQAVYSGIGSVADGPISEVVWGYNPNLKPYTQDLDKARQLMAEAGYPDGFTVRLSTNDSQARVDTAEMINNQLNQIGITLEVETIENATFLDKVIDGDVEMFILGWTTSTGDSNAGLYEPFYSEQPTWANTAQYSNPEVDALLLTGKDSSNDQVRLDAYYKAQELIVDDAPWVFLYNSEILAATGANIEGFSVHPSSRHSLNTITIKQ